MESHFVPTGKMGFLLVMIVHLIVLFKPIFLSFCLSGSQPELTTVSSLTPPEDKPDHSPTMRAAVDPERAEIQARTPEPVLYSPAERQNTASPDQQGAPHKQKLPTAVSPTLTPVVSDFKDPNSVPVRGDVLAPLQLPPLPTTRSKPSQLDISQGVEEGGLTGSGRGESSGGGQQPAVVFKEDVTPATGLMFDKSPAPTEEESAKPPFHLIIVNVNDQNQSGE